MLEVNGPLLSYSAEDIERSPPEYWDLKTELLPMHLMEGAGTPDPGNLTAFTPDTFDYLIAKERLFGATGG